MRRSFEDLAKNSGILESCMAYLLQTEKVGCKLLSEKTIEVKEKP